MEATMVGTVLEGRSVQVTSEGDRVVTVARDGARMAGHGNGIYVTAVYVARQRQRDGVLTWRLERRAGVTTSGKKVTPPMVVRAKALAEEMGLPYVQGVRYGQVCK